MIFVRAVPLRVNHTPNLPWGGPKIYPGSGGISPDTHKTRRSEKTQQPLVEIELGKCMVMD